MIDYSFHGDAYETLSMLSSIDTADDLFGVFPTSSDDASHLFFDDYSLSVGIGAFDNLLYEESLGLPLLEEPPHHEEADTTEGDVGRLPPLLLPGVDAELDRTMSIFHLLKAYGEATSTENAPAELARVILARLRQKASPVGTAMERLAHYLLLQESDPPQAEFLTQESIKNFPLALQAIYEMTPYGRFAHFVANAAVHESVPRDVDVSVHIVDFVVGEGVQWPPLLAALGPHRSVRITCMDVDDECYRFERTKERLLAFAQTMRLKLRVDRMRMEELQLLLEKKRMEVTGSEWLVFNCMVGLPHMGGMANRKVRSKLEEFINVARRVIASNGRRGLLVCGGNAEADGLVDTSPFSDAHLLHSHALFESMEWHFPSTQFSLARAAMECLFVGPACASSSADGYGLDQSINVCSGLEGFILSKQNLLEAKEIVRRGGQHYGLRTAEDDGKCGNELVLEWRGTPLVRVCAWR